MKGSYQITKADFYNAGGFSNPRQYRKQFLGVYVYRRLVD